MSDLGPGQVIDDEKTVPVSESEHSKIWAAIYEFEKKLDKRLRAVEEYVLNRGQEISALSVRVRALEIQMAKVMGLPDGLEWTLSKTVEEEFDLATEAGITVTGVTEGTVDETPDA